ESDPRHRFDGSLATVVGGGAADRLEHRHALGVDVASGRDAHAALHRGGEVGEDVADNVVRHHEVAPAWILQEVDAGGVDVDVGGPHGGVRGRRVVEGALPEIAGVVEHVRLVGQCHV